MTKKVDIYAADIVVDEVLYSFYGEADGGPFIEQTHPRTGQTSQEDFESMELAQAAWQTLYAQREASGQTNALDVMDEWPEVATEFAQLDPVEAMERVKDGYYSPEELETLLEYDVRAGVKWIIKQYLPKEEVHHENTQNTQKGVATVEGEMLEPDAGEILPQESAENSNCTPCVILQSTASEINAIFEEFKKAEALATISAVRLGLLLEFVKEQLPHGQLLKWIKENCSMSQGHTQRFRGIAKKFLAEHKLSAGELFGNDPVLQLGNGEVELSVAMPEESAQMLFDFVGDRTLPELCEDIGVRWREKPKSGKGGDRGGGLARANRTPEEAEEAALQAIRANWQEKAGFLNSEGIELRTWAELQEDEIRGLLAIVTEISQSIQQHLTNLSR